MQFTNTINNMCARKNAEFMGNVAHSADSSYIKCKQVPYQPAESFFPPSHSDEHLVDSVVNL